MTDKTTRFYDDLARDYHLVYADWDRSIRLQAIALDGLIRSGAAATRRTVLDCTCGAGTQALGLASLGYEVVGTDISVRAIERAREEAERRGLDIEFSVADIRTLRLGFDSKFDVVMSADNSLPHLITAADLRAGVDRMVAHLKPGGLFLASIRDYDAILEDRPVATPPVTRGEAGDRSVTFQLWHWESGRPVYEMEMFVLHEREGATWQCTTHTARYRALRREELTDVLGEAGLERIEWSMPQSSGFFQPLVTAILP